MRLLTTRGTWRGLSGFGHLAQYYAIQAGPGDSNWHDAMNPFAHFKFFAEQVCEKKPAGTQYARPLDEAQRGKRGNRSTAQGNAHDYTRQYIAQKMHTQHDAGYRNA